MTRRVDCVDDAYCRSLAVRFFARGHEPEDLAQEARLAMLTAHPAYRYRVARLRVLDVVKVANRRAFEPRDIHDLIHAADVGDLVEARERLRAIVEAPRTENERQAVGRVLRGEPIRRHEKALQVALGRVRERLAT